MSLNFTRGSVAAAAVLVSMGASADVTAERTPKAKVNYIANFSPKIGANPSSEPIVASDGNYYGVLPNQSRNDVGSVYRLTPTGELTVMHRFKGSDGANPMGRLVQASDGALYGTTHAGGRGKGCGTVYRLTLDEAFSTVHVFNCGKHGGANPSGGLIQAQDGQLYGMTEGGGTHRDGTVYSTTLDGAYTVVGNFAYAFSGAKPKGELVQTTDGTFYGITSVGGAHDAGTLFSMSSNGTLTRQHAFEPGSMQNGGLAYLSSLNQVWGTFGSGSVYIYTDNRLFVFATLVGDVLAGGVTLGPDGETMYGFCSNDSGGCLYSVNYSKGKVLRLVDHIKGSPAGRPAFTDSTHIIGATQGGGNADDGAAFSIDLQ